MMMIKIDKTIIIVAASQGFNPLFKSLLIKFLNSTYTVIAPSIPER